MSMSVDHVLQKMVHSYNDEESNFTTNPASYRQSDSSRLYHNESHHYSYHGSSKHYPHESSHNHSYYWNIPTIVESNTHREYQHSYPGGYHGEGVQDRNDYSEAYPQPLQLPLQPLSLPSYNNSYPQYTQPLKDCYSARKESIDEVPGPPLPWAESGGHHRKQSSLGDFLATTGLFDEPEVVRECEGTRQKPPQVPSRQVSEDPVTIHYHSPVKAYSESVVCQPTLPTSPIVTSSQAAAAAATQKARSRRACSTPGCCNRVVQGGLCISHGARRKTCAHPGCFKNVKKAGLCSAHGPARKRCEIAGCIKVAVQGGRCIAHGAKKKACCMDDCTKQAIMGGMCKKHYDEVNGVVKVRAPRGSGRRALRLKATQEAKLRLVQEEDCDHGIS